MMMTSTMEVMTRLMRMIIRTATRPGELIVSDSNDSVPKEPSVK